MAEAPFGPKEAEQQLPGPAWDVGCHGQWLRQQWLRSLQPAAQVSATRIHAEF